MFQVRSMIVGLAMAFLAVAVVGADEKKEKPEKKKGSVTGVVTAKEKNWIEVKADGEEKARRYVPHWRGGAPDQGGGLDKEMLKTFAALKIGTRIQLDWEFEERLRAVKVEVLKAPQR